MNQNLKKYLVPDGRKCSYHATTDCQDHAAIRRGRYQFYCQKHYRYLRMREKAKRDGKQVPAYEWLDANWPNNMICPACGKLMEITCGQEVKKDVLTLQHDRSGKMRIICFGCNSAHDKTNMPEEFFYQENQGMKWCGRCRKMLPEESFGVHSCTRLGLNSFCKKCKNAYSRSWKLSRASLAVAVSFLLFQASAQPQEISALFASELYNRTGEIKSGFGLRGRYWFNEVGVEAQGLSLTPRDSIVDRSDLSVCWRYEFGGSLRSGDARKNTHITGDDARLDQRDGATGGDHSGHRNSVKSCDSLASRQPISLILSAGYGSNWEDHAHGPGIGAAVQYHRGNWFGEVGTRAIWEDYSKTLLTIGLGRTF